MTHHSKSMKNKFCIILLCQLFFAIVTIHSQTQFCGHVFFNKKPIFAASVYLENNNNVSTTTDEMGGFKLEVPDSLQRDTLVVSSLEFEDFKIALSAITDSCKIELIAEKKTVSLPEVAIKAEVTACNEFATSNLDKVAIYMSPAANADPLKAISLQSYSTSTNENANPELRGSSGNFSRVYVNGVPIKNPVRNQQINGIGNFSLFSPELVAKQMVYPSNPPLEFGNSIGGIVDLRTTENLYKKKETSVSMSLANIGIFHSYQISDKTFMQIYGNEQSSKLYKDLNSSSLNYLHNFHSIDVGINFRTILTTNSFLNLYSYLINEKYGSEKSEYNYTGEQNAKNVRNFYILNYRLHKNNNTFGANVSWDISKNSYEYGAISDTTQMKNLFISLSAKHYYEKNFILSIGCDYEYNFYKYRGEYPVASYFLGNMDSTKIHKKLIISNKFETFVYSKWQMDNFAFSASGRWGYLSKSCSYISWQANIKCNISNTNTLFLSFGNYNSMTIPSYYYRKIENATSKQISLDWKYSINSKIAFSAAVYKKIEKIPYVLVNMGGTEFLRNNIFGVELSGNYKWQNFEFYGCYVLLDSRFNYLGKKYDTENNFKHMLKGIITYINNNICNFSISCLYRKGLPYTPIEGNKGTCPIFGELNSKRYKRYFTIDLSVNKHINLAKVGITPFISITNIFNQINQHYFYYNYDYSQTKVNPYQKRLIYFGCNINI